MRIKHKKKNENYIPKTENQQLSVYSNVNENISAYGSDDVKERW